MAGQAFTSSKIDYVKLVKSKEHYELIGPKDVLEPIFNLDHQAGQMQIFEVVSKRCNAQRMPITFTEEWVVKVDCQSQLHVYTWTWTAWVRVLTSHGFRCKSVAHGCGGYDNVGIQDSEIWLFERERQRNA